MNRASWRTSAVDANDGIVATAGVLEGFAGGDDWPENGEVLRGLGGSGSAEGRG